MLQVLKINKLFKICNYKIITFAPHITSQVLAVYINNENFKDDKFEGQTNNKNFQTKPKNLQLILTAAL